MSLNYSSRILSTRWVMQWIKLVGLKLFEWSPVVSLVHVFQSCLSSSPDFNLQQRQALASGNGTICVFIQLPVEDLRQLALRTVRQNVSKKEDCFCLDIPLSIQFELAQMFV